MIWWLWIFLGLVLLGVEMMMPGGFYMLFLGLAALTVGALAGLNLVGEAWVQWLLFSVLSLGSLLVFREPLRRLTQLKSPTDDVANGVLGELALVQEDLAPGAFGKAELRGTVWSAKNAGPSLLKKGARGRVARVDGLTLWLQSEP